MKSFPWRIWECEHDRPRWKVEHIPAEHAAEVIEVSQYIRPKPVLLDERQGKTPEIYAISSTTGISIRTASTARYPLRKRVTGSRVSAFDARGSA